VTKRPPLAVVVTLLAGRTAFRSAVVLSAPLLLAVWGPDEFGPYALAVGTTLVLNPLVGSGTEKSAGTLLPRAGSFAAAGRLLSAHLLTAAAITAGSLLLTIPFSLLDRHRTGLWLLAGATNVGFGAVQALVAYWRVLGVPSVDAASFGALTAVTASGVALAAFTGTGPLGYLTLQAVTSGVVCAGLAYGLRRRLGQPRRRTVLLVGRTTVLLGANTLLSTAPFSVVIAVLGGQSNPAAVSGLYVAVTAYTIVGNALDYLQRVYQPWLTGTLLANPDRVLDPVRRGGWLAVTVLAPAGALAVLGTSSLVGMTAVAPMLLATALVTWVLENHATATLAATTRAAAVGLAGTACAAILLVPPLAASGALLALLAGTTIRCGLLIANLSGTGANDYRDPQPSDAR